MDGMWHLNAPQWTDFESSPQIPEDDYFEREHENLEPQPLIEVVPVASPDQSSEKNVPKVQNNLLQVPGKNDSLINEIEVAKMTPVRVVSPTLRNKKNCTTKETTYDNVLSEAMASLQLSVKKKSQRSQNTRNTLSNLVATPTNATKTIAAKSLNLYRAARSTPSNPIPMWIRKTKPSEANVEDHKKTPRLFRKEEPQETLGQDNVILHEEVARKEEDPEIDEILINNQPQKSNDNVNRPHNKDLEPNEQPKVAGETNKLKENMDDLILENTAPLIVVNLPGRSKRSSNVSQSSSIQSNKGSQPARFSTCQLRRRSLTQYRRRSNKFVSLAEAISKFQNKTPVRFRSVSSKNGKPGPVQKLRQSSVAVTVPISPALRCKSRSRPTVLSHEERERLEIEETRKNSVRENLGRSNSAKNLSRNNMCSKISCKRPAATISEGSSSKSIENKNLNAEVNREIEMKVTVPSVVSTEEGIVIQNAEISNFGVPDMTTVKTDATKTAPFSFEARNKEMQRKKEQKIKELMTKEENKNKMSFHARPVPAFKKPMIAPARETKVARPMTKSCPFSFEERDKNLLKKKENFIKTVLEEDKKARMFQAKPLPEFKPVLVRGISKENINSGNKPVNPSAGQKTRISMLPVSKTGSRNCLLVKASVSNQENQNPYPKLERSKSVEIRTESQQKVSTVKVLAEFHLNTDKRAKERKEFDERIKQKEQEIELLRKEADAEKLKRDEMEKAEIRRMAETKAKPMPAYKPPAVIRSNKPLTEPQSPGWSTKPKR